MRAYEVLFESDERSKIQKLRDVINHPNTEETVKAVAQGKLNLLLSSMPAEPPAPRIVIETNLTDDLLDVPYVGAKTAGQIYEALSTLSPTPNRINFLRQGTIQMMVPPPFNGLSKQAYYNMINEAVGGCRGINATLVPGQGYFFSISFL
jgi:hypothetical protein